MANIMSLKSIMNKPSRNGFDLSTKRNFTAKAGELLPVWWTEILRGDTTKINLSSFARTMPVNTAAYARVREYYDFYFVPYSHLWNRANAVLTQMDYNQMHATALFDSVEKYSGEMPYFTTDQVVTYLQGMKTLNPFFQQNYFEYNRAQLTCKLLEYLGYGDFSGCLLDSPTYPTYNLDLNAGPLLAYQKIYADYFRDQQWERPIPSCFNVDYMSGSSSMNMNIPAASNSNAFFYNYNMFDMRYCSWPKDLYHGLLPSPQYGETTVIPLASDMESIPVLSGAGSWSLDNSLFLRSDRTQPTATENFTENQEYPTGFVYVPRNGSNVSPLVVNALSSVNNVSGLSILALRQFEFLQKWKEIAQSGNQDYKDMTKRIWNVDVSNHLSDMCTYLGGIDASLDINEVVNTNITETNQAEIAGKGVSVSNGNIEFSGAQEPGFLMCIYHAMPIVDYTVGYINPQVLRVNAEDYANPVFDRVGMQGVSSASLFGSYQVGQKEYVTPNNMGYAPRYIDYKTAIDLSMGGFRKTLSHWVVSYDEKRIFNELVTLSSQTSQDVPSESTPPVFDIADGSTLGISYPFMKINPALLDPIFATAVDSSVDTDQFLCSAFFDVKMVRNLDTDGLPY